MSGPPQQQQYQRQPLFNQLTLRSLQYVYLTSANAVWLRGQAIKVDLHGDVRKADLTRDVQEKRETHQNMFALNSKNWS